MTHPTHLHRAFVFLLLLACSVSLVAQHANGETAASEPPKKEKRVNLIALPLVFATPETSWGFGAAGAVNFRTSKKDTSDRLSQVLFGGAYTLFDQVLSYANYNLFFDQEKFWLKGEFGYYRYFFYYYGVGRNSRLIDEETYNVDFPRIRLDALTRQSLPFFSNTGYIGLRYWMDSFQNLKPDPDGQLMQETFSGTRGGTISGVGPLLIFDTRDNIFSATRGYKLEVSTLLFHEALGSSYRYTQTNLDASFFLLVSKKLKHVFGAQILSENQWGDVPFFALSRVGSAKMMRGHYSGRFLEKKQLAGQVEYRFPLFWRLEQTVFASSSFIGDEFNDFRLDQYIPALGSGLRFVINEADRIKVRLDVAYGEELNFYLTFNEAF